MKHKELGPGIFLYNVDLSKEYNHFLENMQKNNLNWITQKSEHKNIDFLLLYKNEEEDVNDIKNPFMYETSNLFINLFNPYKEHYQSCFQFEETKFNLTENEYVFLLKYYPGSINVSHFDDSRVDKIRRTTLVYYPTDDYEGGALRFLNFDVSIKPEKNDLIMFPSNYVYAHSVDEVISGDRTIMGTVFS